MPGISPASESNEALHQYRVLDYSEISEAQSLFKVKSLTIQVVIEANTADHMYHLEEYSELNTAMSLSWVKQPPTPEEPTVEVTIGGGRTIGVFGPIMGAEFEQEIKANIAFSREFSLTQKLIRPAFVPAVIEFSQEAPGHAHFAQKVLFSYPGTRMVALHYSQVLREDRELVELIEMGIL